MLGCGYQFRLFMGLQADAGKAVPALQKGFEFPGLVGGHGDFERAIAFTAQHVADNFGVRPLLLHFYESG